MATVFDVFREVEMTYVDLARARAYGDLTRSSKQIRGIFKYRGGFNSTNGLEASESSATVHVHPNDFETIEELIGNGIVYDGIDYQIIGVTEGRNFDNNTVEHYTLTLKRANIQPDSNQLQIEDEFV